MEMTKAKAEMTKTIGKAMKKAETETATEILTNKTPGVFKQKQIFFPFQKST